MMSDRESPEFLAPHSVEAEEALLGALLINPDAMLNVISFLRPEDFFILRNRWVYEAMLRIHDREEAIDNLIVTEELRVLGHLEKIGDGYVTYLINNTPTSLHAEVYGRIIERTAVRRRILEAAGEISQLAITESIDIEKVISEARFSINEAVKDHIEGSSLRRVDEIVLEYYNEAEAAFEQETGVIEIIETGFKSVDKLLNMERGHYAIFAGPPGSGKTAFCIAVMLNMAKAGHTILFQSIEMTGDEVIRRMFAIEADIQLTKLKLGGMTDKEWDRFVEATGVIGGLNIWIDDAKKPTLQNISSSVDKVEPDVVFVDYLQLIREEGRSNENLRVAAISKGLNELGDEYDTLVIALSQLSRKYADRKEKRPVLQDLRESGQIEQDADTVAFVHREEMFDEGTNRPNQADIIVAKNRDNAMGSAALYFKKQMTAFKNLKINQINLSGY
jgi:replicative DNA helicase